MEMHTLPREQSGLFFDENIPLINSYDFTHDDDKQEIFERVKAFNKRKHPKADFNKIDPIGFGKKKGNENTLVTFGSKGGESEILKKDGTGLLISFTDRFKGALGPSAEDIVAEKDKTIIEEKQRPREAEKQLKEVDRQKTADNVQQLRNRIEETQAKIDALEEEQGSNVESENELQRLKQLKKIFKPILKTKKIN